MPESAVCLVNREIAQVLVGDGCCGVVLLEGTAKSLAFSSEARASVPVEVQRLLQELFEGLEGCRTRRCVIDFVEWLYATKPTSLATVLKYFLNHRNDWLVEIPAQSESESRFLKPSIATHSDDGRHWHELQHLRVASGSKSAYAC